MSIAFWVITGILLGCATAALTGSQTAIRLFSYATVGTFGAAITGILYSLIDKTNIFSINMIGAGITTIGALALLVVTCIISAEPRQHS